MSAHRIVIAILIYVVLYALLVAGGFAFIGNIPQIQGSVDNYIKASAVIVAGVTAIMTASLSLFIVNAQIKASDYTRYEKVISAAQNYYIKLSSLQNGHINTTGVDEADDKMAEVFGLAKLLPPDFERACNKFYQSARHTKEIYQKSVNENKPLNEEEQIELWMKQMPKLTEFIDAMTDAIPRR